MSQVVAISLELDAGQSVREVESLEKAIKKVKDTTDLTTVEQNFNDLNNAVDSGGNSVENLQRAIKSYQTIALTAGRQSPIGKQAIERASALQDELADLNNEIKRNAHDGRAMQGALEIGTTVTSGYQAFAGVTALVGEENEELLATLTKLQATQGVLQGLEQIRVSLEKESVAVLALKNAQQKIQNGLMIAYNVIVGAGTKAMKLFRLALVATGIGALIALIGTLIANWDSWGDAIMDFINSALEPFKKGLQFLGLVESENDAIRREAHENNVAQTKEQIAMLQEQEQAIQDKYDYEIRLLRASGKATDEIEKKKLKAVLNRTIEEGKALYKLYELEGELNEEQVERLEELTGLIKKQSQDLEVFEAQQRTNQENADKKSFEKRKQIRDKAHQQEIEDERKKEQLKLDLQKTFQDLLIANIEDEAERKRMAQKLAFEREREQLIEQFGKNERLLEELDKNQRNKKAELEAELKAEKQEVDQVAKAKEIEKIKAHQLLIAQNLKEAFDKEIEEEKNKNEAKIAMQNAYLSASQSAVKSLFDLAGQSEKGQKAVALAEIAINTGKAISSLVANSQANPLNSVTGGVAGAVQYATGLASILKNIARAKSILSSGSGAGISAPSIPSASGGSTRTENRTTRNTDNGGNENAGRKEFYNNRAIVVESDVNDIRNRLNTIDVISSI